MQPKKVNKKKFIFFCLGIAYSRWIYIFRNSIFNVKPKKSNHIRLVLVHFGTEKLKFRKKTENVKIYFKADKFHFPSFCNILILDMQKSSAPTLYRPR